jgi:hypothetical protein
VTSNITLHYDGIAPRCHQTRVTHDVGGEDHGERAAVMAQAPGLPHATAQAKLAICCDWQDDVARLGARKLQLSIPRKLG